MTLVADESVDRPIVDRLRLSGHDVVYVKELSPSITDDEVLQLANDSNCLLLTGDKDFGELVYRLGRVHGGVVLQRLGGLSNDKKAETVAKVFQDHAAELVGAFTVIAPGSVRIRRTP
jgi:predicted nuclease of predicted toxin-antitoxin system